MNCPYCNSLVEEKCNSIIYGRSYGQGRVLICSQFPICDAYVGVYKNQPQGTLANRELREWRKRAHATFDPIWKTGNMSRKEAYQQLARNMNISQHNAHIAQFNIEQCKQLINLYGGIKIK